MATFRGFCLKKPIFTCFWLLWRGHPLYATPYATPSICNSIFIKCDVRIYFGVSSTRKRICKIQYRWDLARRNFSKVKKKLEGLCNIPILMQYSYTSAHRSFRHRFQLLPKLGAGCYGNSPLLPVRPRSCERPPYPTTTTFPPYLAGVARATPDKWGEGGSCFGGNERPNARRGRPGH